MDPAATGEAATEQAGDLEIRLERSRASTLDSHAHHGAHHDRSPDIGIGIRVFLPSHATGINAVEYYGEYLGHGQSKTAFELQCPGARFDGSVLKVAKTLDLEPSVFAQGSQHGLTTSILYENRGNDGSRRYHCWITERTIPLDQFLQYHGADKQRCSLAAFVCMLRAARSGLYLSDCHFFNFGVKLSENATEQLPVSWQRASW